MESLILKTILSEDTDVEAGGMFQFAVAQGEV